MRCVSMERGCEWTGTIYTLDGHLATCLFAVVACPNKCTADKGAGVLHVMNKDLTNHLMAKCPKRAYECQHCGEKGTYASITEDHDKVCDKKMVPCPNKGSGCPLSTERGRLEQHVRRACGYTEVACAYESLGCGVRILRKDSERHEKEAREKHVDLSMASVRSVMEDHRTLSEGEAVVFKLPGYAEKKKRNEEFCSKPFYSHPCGYKMCISVDVDGHGDGKGTHVSVYTTLLQGCYDHQLHWPFLGTVTYRLLNQLADDKHHTRAITHGAIDDMRVGVSRGCPRFAPHSSLPHDPVTNRRYLVDDTLYFKVSVNVDNHKPWLVCSDKISVACARTIKDDKTLKNGKPLVFKVTDYHSRKDRDENFISDSFYTSAGGYRMSIKVVPNGNDTGKDTHMSVHVTLLEGPHDASLHWPFVGTVTISLLNQLADKKHHSRTLEVKASANARVGDVCGTSRFVPHSSLSHDQTTSRQYLLDDALYFRVTVKADNHKPWLICTRHP